MGAASACACETDAVSRGPQLGGGLSLYSVKYVEGRRVTAQLINTIHRSKPRRTAHPHVKVSSPAYPRTGLFSGGRLEPTPGPLTLSLPEGLQKAGGERTDTGQGGSALAPRGAKVSGGGTERPAALATSMQPAAPTQGPLGLSLLGQSADEQEEGAERGPPGALTLRTCTVFAHSEQLCVTHCSKH